LSTEGLKSLTILSVLKLRAPHSDNMYRGFAGRRT
jgi:hypothetical protein